MSTSYSWERHKQSEESSMSKSIGRKKSDDEDLFVFGYSCKIFADEKKARFLDQGKHLIPWMGSDQLLIDRFDVRGYLQDLKKYEAKGFDSKEPAEELSQEELQFEKQLDQERFADLEMDEDYHEEEMKRLKAALAIDGPYHEIGFHYDTNPEEINQVEGKREEAVEEEPTGECITDPFILPPELTLPDGIELPQTMKQHNLIEKTAKFISTHGVQMEILIKTKQSSNSQFDFLAFDSPLNPYYKHLVHAIKTGKYNAKCDDANSSDESPNEDDDSEDGNYLHPSLLGSRNKKASPTKPLVLPTLPRSENDSYAQLVKSLRGKIPVEEKVDLESKEATPQGTRSKFLDNPETSAIIPPVTLNTNPTTQSVQNTLSPTWPSLLPTPPPEIELIIEKLAQYVAKNGEEFEFTVRKRNEERFEFLNPGNKYHAHYIRRKLHHLEEKRKTQAAELKLKSSNQTCVTNSSSNSCVEAEPEKYPLKTPVSFCFKKTSVSPDAEKVTKSETIIKQEKMEAESKKPDVALADKLAAAARDRLSREKMLQEERKRKAALFISMMRSKELIKKEQPEEQSIGPSLPNQPLLSPVTAVADPISDNIRLKKTCDVSKLINVEMNFKKTSCLPFLIKDEPLKETTKNSHVREMNEESRGHRHHRRHRHQRRHDKCRSRSKSRSRSRSPLRSRSRSHHSKSSSRSRTRSRSKSRSKKLKRRSRSRSRTSK